MSNKPVISTAKVRGLIKKNGINYVDATGRMYPTIQNGISVWQLCDTVYCRVFGRTEEISNKNLAALETALESIGLTITIPDNRATFEIVKAGA